MSPLLETRDLSVHIGDRQVCDNLDLRIGNGECWALLGRNGTGKTTLLHHLAGLRSGHSGNILTSGQNLAQLTPRSRAQQIGILLQHSNRGFGASVFDTVLSGRHPHLSGLGWESAADVDIAMRSATALGLDHLTRRSLQTLSGGELRRVEIARLLTQQTPLSLLDEPTNHLDLAHQAECIHTLLAQCVSAERAMLLVVHDLNLAYRVCDHWLILDGDGRWQAGTREALGDSRRLSTAYAHPISRIDSDDGPVFLPGL